MEATIKKINELVYQEDYAYCETDQVNLEMLLVALQQSYITTTCLEIKKVHISCQDNDFELIGWFHWQLNKTLTEQSEQTQQTIKNLFE